jgi:hypothetical protein
MAFSYRSDAPAASPHHRNADRRHHEIPENGLQPIVVAGQSERAQSNDRGAAAPIGVRFSPSGFNTGALGAADG